MKQILVALLVLCLAGCSITKKKCNKETKKCCVKKVK